MSTPSCGAIEGLCMHAQGAQDQVFGHQGFIDENGDPGCTLTAVSDSLAESWPEARLMLAVLEDAIHCYQRYALATSHKGKRLFREAESYIFAPGDQWPYSFVNCCQVLNFDVDCLREGLRFWMQQRLADIVKAPPKIRKRVRSAVTAHSKTRMQSNQRRKRYKKV